MIITHKQPPPTTAEIARFKEVIDFVLPADFWDHYSSANGFTLMRSDYQDARFMQLGEMIALNRHYAAHDLYHGYFIIGDDGAGTAFGIHKATGQLYSILLIGEETMWLADNLNGLLTVLND